MTHLLFRFRHASHGRSLRPLEVVVGFPAFIAFGFDAGLISGRSSAATIGSGAKFTGKFATAADAMLELDHSGSAGSGVANAHQCDDGLSLHWTILAVGVGRD